MSVTATIVDEDEPKLVQPDYVSKPVTLLKDAVVAAISFVSKGANGQRWLLMKSADTKSDGSLSCFSELIQKANDTPGDFTTAFVVIAIPEEVDLQKDVWTAEEIEKACNAFIPAGGILNLEHQNLDSVGQLVQNYVAPADTMVKTPSGEMVKIPEGAWVIGVQPNPEVKKLIQSGQITGMSVQGSARREPVAKSDKYDRPIARGTTGAGIVKLQHLLGVEESEKYDEATEIAFMQWMKDRGVPGTPTQATLRMAITETVPEAAPAQEVPVEEPVASGAVPTEKDVDGYNPSANDTTPPVPEGAMGVDIAHVTVDSPSEDLKALIARSIREGNAELAEHMEQTYRGSTVGDLYGQDISHADLWFMISKFVVGDGVPSIDANGEYETPGANSPAVEKGTWDGSHGGNDPDAHNGNAYNFVRTFGEWAKGKQSIAARKLLENGVVKTPEAANRLAAWLKDQWMNSTKWRKGNQDNLHKSDADFLSMCKEIDENPDDLLRKLEDPKLHTSEPEGEDRPKPPSNDLMSKIAKILQSGEPVEKIVSSISEVLSSRSAGEGEASEPALKALHSALTEVAREDDEEKRISDIEDILRDFARWMQHSKVSAATAPENASVPESAQNDKPRTFLHKGEDMDRTLIDEATAQGLSTAVNFITNALNGTGGSEDVPAEVEKDAHPAFGGKKAKPFGAKAPASPEDGVATEAPEASADEAKAETDVPAEVEEALEDEGDDVTEEELLQVVNYLAEEVDSLREQNTDQAARISQLENLDGKLDKVGELAKALGDSDTTSERIDALVKELSEVSKKLEAGATNDELQSVVKRLDGIASTTSRSSAIPVDVKVPEARQAVAKQDNSEGNLWGSMFR